MAAANTDKFKKSKRKFSTTIDTGDFAQAATTLPLVSVSGLATDTAVTLIIDPGGASEEVITGVVSGSDIVNCVRGKEGTSDQDHVAGDTVVEYFTQTHWDDAMTGILAEHAQDGSHTDITADTIEATSGTFDSLTINGSATEEGWSPLGDTPDTITNKGNRSYDLVFNSTDYTDRLSPGMKLRLTRTVTAPTQCADLEASSSHYFRDTSVSGMTFTDDFVVSAWIKLESYAAMTIMSRYNGTSGWKFSLTSSGQVELYGYNAGAANFSGVYSYASVPLNKWVHVAAQLDMSAYTATTTTSYIMFDGLDVPAVVNRGGTNPTALVQAGNLEVGSQNGGTALFDGKLAQVAVYSAKVTQANVLATISQGLSGSETSLISAYSFNNSITDLNTSNANNLTAMNSAVATDTDTPFAGGATGTTEYAEITNVSFSTDTTIGVRVSEYGMIPTTGGVSAMAYSTQEKPFGCPHFSKILGIVQIGSSFTVSSATDTQISGLSLTVVVPTNSRIKVSVLGGALYNTTGGDGATVKIWDGVVSSGKLLNGSAQVGSATTYSYAPAMAVATLLASGSKTFNASLRYGSSGVAHLDSETSTGRQPYLIVELV